MEDEVVAISWSWGDWDAFVMERGENGRPPVKARDGAEDGLVGDGDFESGDVNLLWPAEEFLHFVGDNRGLITGDEKLGGRVLVEDGVVEGLDCEP